MFDCLFQSAVLTILTQPTLTNFAFFFGLVASKHSHWIVQISRLPFSRTTSSLLLYVLNGVRLQYMREHSFINLGKQTQISYSEGLILLLNFLLVVAPLDAFLFSHGDLSQHFPESPEFLGLVLGSSVCNEVLFYYSHRWMHRPFLYKHVHSWHHKFHSTNALAAAYCHPFEMLLCNVLPAFAFLSVVRPHEWFLWIWSLTAVYVTQCHHSGYCENWLSSLATQPRFHDAHHKRLRGNYGSGMFMDKLCGTVLPIKKNV